jgi:hypothetical protein
MVVAAAWERACSGRELDRRAGEWDGRRKMGECGNMGRVFVVWMIARARPCDPTWREASTLPIGSWHLETSMGVLNDLLGCKMRRPPIGAAAASPNSR